MKYSIVISSAKQLNGFTDFATEQFNRHFAVWLLEDPQSTFSLKWIKNALFLKTDSSVLVEKWLTIEQDYLKYLLNADQSQYANVHQDYDYANVA